MNISSLDQKRAQRESDAKERLLNLPQKQNKITKLLDNDDVTKKLDLLRHLDNDHILKKISLSIENTKFVAYPSSTAFIMILTVFSGYASRMYKVSIDSHDMRGVPIGIYAIAEQPSGSAKDFTLNMVSNIFGDAFTEFKRDAKKRFKEATKKKKDMDKSNPDKEILDEFNAAENLFDCASLYKLSLSDTTPAGLEKTLIDTNGFFNLCSSEQTLLNVLVGGLFSNGQSNNEVLLKGYDGGKVEVSRGGRDSYYGPAGGSLAVFAQKGSIKTIFKSSELSGLHERILKIAEPNRGGDRDFINGKSFNWFLYDELKEILDCMICYYFSEENITNPKGLYELPLLTISSSADKSINLFQQEMEDLLKPGGIYYDSKTDMMGTLSKCNIGVVKIASSLHLLDNGFYENCLRDKHVISAINIMRDIILSYKDLMANESLTGDKANYEKILSYLSKSNQPRPIQDICSNLKGVKPFTMPSSSKVIRKTIEEMIDHDVLKISLNGCVLIA